MVVVMVGYVVSPTCLMEIWGKPAAFDWSELGLTIGDVVLAGAWMVLVSYMALIDSSDLVGNIGLTAPPYHNLRALRLEVILSSMLIQNLIVILFLMSAEEVLWSSYSWVFRVWEARLLNPFRLRRKQQLLLASASIGIWEIGERRLVLNSNFLYLHPGVIMGLNGYFSKYFNHRTCLVGQLRWRGILFVCLATVVLFFSLGWRGRRILVLKFLLV